MTPELKRPGIARAIAAGTGRFESAGGRLVFAAELAQAPWRLVYVVGRLELARSIAARSAVAIAGPLAGLVLLLLVAHAATRREFVTPATKLVAHIDAAGREAGAEVADVPAAWRPFFTAVSESFAAHGQLVAIRHELDVARRMQDAILPPALPPHTAIDVRARMIPALEVGGDFYDYFWLDATRLGVVVADVSDKGLGAALFMAVSRTLLRAIAPAAVGPAAALHRVSEVLAEDNPTNMFVTAFYGVIDVGTGELVYASGGHLPPLVVGGGAVAPLPKVRGAALGMFPGQRFDEGRAVLPAGAALFVYTDGVTEAVAPDRAEFGADRLAATLAAQAGAPADAMLAAVLRAVDDFAAGTPQADDITCLVVHRHGGP